MKVALIGCVKSSEMALRTLLEIADIEVCAVVTKEKSAVNSDFVALSDICREHGVPYHEEVLAKKSDSFEFLKAHNPDLIYCIGWSYLLGSELIKLPPLGVVGFHPAKLPSNRGRHPIIWALALGLEETASTFFMIDEGTDSGPIVDQQPIKIIDTDDSEALYSRIIEVAKHQLVNITSQFLAKTHRSIPQDENQATYWRKRDRRDGMLDFRMSAKSIRNLVRALRPPYPCAEFIFHERYFKVTDTQLSEDLHPINIEFGKVLSVSGSNILVKLMGNEAIWLSLEGNHNIVSGDYLR